MMMWCMRAAVEAEKFIDEVAGNFAQQFEKKEKMFVGGLSPRMPLLASPCVWESEFWYVCLLFAAKIPEQGSEDDGEEGRVDDPNGRVERVPPVGPVLLPEAGHALSPERLSILSCEVEVVCAGTGRAQLAYQSFISPELYSDYTIFIYVIELAGWIWSVTGNWPIKFRVSVKLSKIDAQRYFLRRRRHFKHPRRRIVAGPDFRNPWNCLDFNTSTLLNIFLHILT